MWALGCIFGEMQSQRCPPFTGQSTISQLEKIVEFLGFPTEQDMVDVNSSYVNTLFEGCNAPDIFRDFQELYPNASEDALYLLKKLLQWNPKKRITAAEALNHPFMAEFQGTMSEGDSPVKITLPDGNLLSKDTVYRENMLQEFMVKLKKQHEPLANAAILVHNIARSTEALSLLPIELWILIFKMMDDDTRAAVRPYEVIARRVFNYYFKSNK